ncbi:translation initiation factor IF-2-like [Manacus candei]|uniref:translation initiation factor IF-2-like n=1 Tax=Manacus candei TaxID=415023 RepID=UPI0022279285|nr:translation initiation factor IF-2-like [Manacus candei]
MRCTPRPSAPPLAGYREEEEGKLPGLTNPVGAPGPAPVPRGPRSPAGLSPGALPRRGEQGELPPSPGGAEWPRPAPCPPPHPPSPGSGGEAAPRVTRPAGAPPPHHTRGQRGCSLCPGARLPPSSRRLAAARAPPSQSADQVPCLQYKNLGEKPPAGKRDGARAERGVRRRPASPSVGKRRDARRPHQPLLTGDGRCSPLSAAQEELFDARSKSEAAAVAAGAPRGSVPEGWYPLADLLESDSARSPRARVGSSSPFPVLAPGHLPQQGSAEGGRTEGPWG